MDPRLSLTDVVAHAQRIERLGYDGLHVAETVHDSMAVALLAAEHTERITIRTSVALAFTRSPTLLAYAAWDISKLSGGRFQLGLGTQIRQNIEDRYGVPFGDDPIGRLRDYVGAVRAAFASFVSGAPPAYESAHYRVRACSPTSTRAPTPRRPCRRSTWAACSTAPVALAGEVAAGFVSHPTNSNPRYLEETCLPALAEGARHGRPGPDRGRVSRRSSGAPVITGATPGAVDKERERQRRLLAFLYSTPAYAPTLQLYGWDDLGPRLRELIRRDQWDDLGGVLSDEVLDTLVSSGSFDELPGGAARALRRPGPGPHGDGAGRRRRRRGLRRHDRRAQGGLSS